MHYNYSRVAECDPELTIVTRRDLDNSDWVNYRPEVNLTLDFVTRRDIPNELSNTALT